MNTIPQTIKLSNGQTLEVPEGADPAAFRRFAEARANPKRRRSPRRRAGSTSRKQNYAAGVIARSMVELVERVNSEVV